jgi:hypothetical protein
MLNRKDIEKELNTFESEGLAKLRVLLLLDIRDLLIEQNLHINQLAEEIDLTTVTYGIKEDEA